MTQGKVTEKPLMFTGPNIQKILARQKTQTRRVVSDRNSIGNFKASELILDKAWIDGGPSPAGNGGPYLHAPVNAPEIERRRGWKSGDCDPEVIERLYPRMQVGDRFWVKEAYYAESRETIHYRADGWAYEDDPNSGWKSPLFMPRWASRITLEVTKVRAQRLQDISEEDAQAEGVEHDELVGYYCDERDGEFGMHRCNWRAGYRAMWDSINGKKSPWESNPFVFAITFTVLEKR